MFDGQMVGALVAGPVLLIDPQEYLDDELAGRLDANWTAVTARSVRISPIPKLKLTVDCCRAAGNDVYYCYVVVSQLQGCADTVVGQTHLNPVFLGIPRRKVV